MKRNFAVSVVRDGKWFVAQCLDVDVASQGMTEAEALENLREALTLYFEPPTPQELPEIRSIEIELGGA